MTWEHLFIIGAWTYFACSVCWRRGHRVGWWRGYLARKHESYPDEFWPKGLTEEEAYVRAKMLRDGPHIGPRGNQQ